jgi:hypothetical protein
MKIMQESEIIKCVELTNDRTETTIATKAVIIQNCGSMIGVHLSLRDYSKEQTSDWMYAELTAAKAREVAEALIHFADRADKGY